MSTLNQPFNVKQDFHFCENLSLIQRIHTKPKVMYKYRSLVKDNILIHQEGARSGRVGWGVVGNNTYVSCGNDRRGDVVFISSSLPLAHSTTTPSSPSPPAKNILSWIIRDTSIEWKFKIRIK